MHPWLLTFPEKDGVEQALLREADLPIFITIVTGCTGNVNQRLLPALANSLLLLTGFMALLPHDLFCDIF